MSNARVNKILNRIPSFWNKNTNSTNYQLVEAFVTELDRFSTETANLKLEIYVATATGQRLDDLGRFFRLSRRPLETDDAYRARIMAYWPGYSGGGTIPAIKSTVNRITGIPEDDVVITEIPTMKFEADILLDSLEDLALKDTIRDTVWRIKAAGVYPFFLWTINGDLLSEDLTVSDSVEVKYITELTWFIWETSIIDGAKVWWKK